MLTQIRRRMLRRLIWVYTVYHTSSSFILRRLIRVYTFSQNCLSQYKKLLRVSVVKTYFKCKAICCCSRYFNIKAEPFLNYIFLIHFRIPVFNSLIFYIVCMIFNSFQEYFSVLLLHFTAIIILMHLSFFFSFSIFTHYSFYTCISFVTL